MKRIEDRQRIAKCGCHYDIVTGIITNYCPDLESCEFKDERLSVIKVSQYAPGIAHLLNTHVERK